METEQIEADLEKSATIEAAELQRSAAIDAAETVYKKKIMDKSAEVEQNTSMKKLKVNQDKVVVQHCEKALTTAQVNPKPRLCR